MNDLISIIMPAFNAEKYIDQAIESVIAQTYKNWELIIIDDGSVDQTKEIICKYSKKDSRISYLFQHNSGQGLARNLGISRAKSNIVAFLDSDDLWVPEKLEIQLFYFKKENIALLFSSAFIISEKNKIIGEFGSAHKKIFFGYESLTELINVNSVTTLTVMANKAAIEDVGGFLTNKEVLIGEDYYLWLKLVLNNYTMMSIKNKLALYRRHSNQSTQDQFSCKTSEITLMEFLSAEYPLYAELFKNKIIHLIKDSLIYINKKDKLFEFKKLYQKYFSSIDYLFLSLTLKIFSSGLFKRYYLYIHSKLFK